MVLFLIPILCVCCLCIFLINGGVSAFIVKGKSNKLLLLETELEQSKEFAKHSFIELYKNYMRDDYTQEGHRIFSVMVKDKYGTSPKESDEIKALTLELDLLRDSVPSHHRIMPLI